MLAFTERIDAAVAAWEAKLRLAQEDAIDGIAPRAVQDDALRRLVIELEEELAALLVRVAHESVRAGEFEVRAMNALRRNDDWAAREALVRQRQVVDQLEELDAEVIVLRAMLADCRATLHQTGA
jgi:phage shock protein A